MRGHPATIFIQPKNLSQGSSSDDAKRETLRKIAEALQMPGTAMLSFTVQSLINDYTHLIMATELSKLKEDKDVDLMKLFDDGEGINDGKDEDEGNVGVELVTIKEKDRKQRDTGGKSIKSF